MAFILTMVIFIITANESHAVYEQLPLSVYDLKPCPLMVKKKKSKSKALTNEDNTTQNHNP